MAGRRGAPGSVEAFGHVELYLYTYVCMYVRTYVCMQRHVSEGEKQFMSALAGDESSAVFCMHVCWTCFTPDRRTLDTPLPVSDGRLLLGTAQEWPSWC